MQLRRLTALEVDKLRAELAEVQDFIKVLQGLLSSEKKQRALVRDELRGLIDEFGCDRRTAIVRQSDLVVINDEAAPAEEDPDLPHGIADQQTLVTLSTSGLLGRRAPDEEFNAKPGRHDVISRSIETSSFAKVSAITDHGRILTVTAREVPEMVRGSRGASVTEMFSLSRGEKVVGLLGESVEPLLLITAMAA